MATAAILSAQTQKVPPRRTPSSRQKTAVPPGLIRAEQAISTKDYATAEPLLLEETRRNPEDFRAWYDLGFVYQETKQPEKALVAFRRSVAIDATNAEAFAALGMLELTLAQNHEAVEHLQKAAAMKPTARIWMALAAAYGPARPDDALAALAKATALATRDPEPRVRAGMIYEQRRDYRHAEKEYLAARELGDGGESLAGLINVYQQTGRSEEAIARLKEFLVRSPNEARAHMQLGRLLADKGDVEGATQQLEAAIPLTDKDAKQLGQIAAEFVALRQDQKAIPLLKRVVQLEPNDARSHLLLATSLNSVLDFAAAESEFVRAIELDPKLPDAYGGLAIAASKNQHHALAIKALDERAKLTADNAGTYFLRATSYDHLQQYPSAIENYHRFLAIANGAYPDQEWQARHRLIAIEPEGKKKK